MQAEMQQAQEQLKDEVVEASAGGGMVKVKMGGDMTLREIAIDPDAIDPEEAELLAEMVQAAVNEGAARGAGARQLEDGRDHRRPAARDVPVRAACTRPAGRSAASRAEHRARRRSPAWSPSWRGCRASGSAPRSGSPSTSCALPTRRPRRSPTAIREVKEKVGLVRALLQPRRGAAAAGSAPTRAATQSMICVVEEPADVIPIERTHEYRGLYHVLGGALSPIDGIDPEDLKIAELRAPGRGRRGRARSCSRPTRPRPARRPRCTSPSCSATASRSPAWPVACRSAPTSSTPTR